jgi:hypothetical protein
LEKTSRVGDLPLDQAIGQETVDRYEVALADLGDEERRRLSPGRAGHTGQVAAMLQDHRMRPVATQRALVRLATKMNHAGQ